MFQLTWCDRLTLERGDGLLVGMTTVFDMKGMSWGCLKLEFDPAMRPSRHSSASSQLSLSLSLSLPLSLSPSLPLSLSRSPTL
eukprot:3973224-Prymnesium_polylepis.1